jgi:ubiquinone/menaquinone biosynthesis C-methylase UbiE
MPKKTKPLPKAYQDQDYIKMSKNFDDSQYYYINSNPIFNSIHNSSHRYISKWNEESSQKKWVLDVGCGQGYHWNFIKNTKNFVGLDIRLESLIKAKQKFPNSFFIQADILHLPFKNESINSAISIYALEHIYWLKESIAELSRILKKNAIFYVGLPCEGGYAWNTGRKLTSERVLSKKYNLNYKKYIALEHCNEAKNIVSSLQKKFEILERKFFPFSFLSSINFNLTISLALKKTN